MIAFGKGTSLKQSVGANTIHNNEKLIKNKKTIIIQESVSYAIQHVVFAVSNLFQQQSLKAIKPKKRLESTIESSAKAAT